MNQIASNLVDSGDQVFPLRVISCFPSIGFAPNAGIARNRSGDNGSKAEVSSASGISPSQVATMRRIKAALGEDAYDFTSWFRARRAAKGAATAEPDDIEQWKHELASRWADAMAKSFSTKMANQPEVAAMAMEMYFGRRLPELVSELRAFVSDDESQDDFPF